MRRILSMVLAAALALSMLSTAAFAQTGEATTIKVFHTNDSHSRAKEVVDSKTEMCIRDRIPCLSWIGWRGPSGRGRCLSA